MHVSIYIVYVFVLVLIQGHGCSSPTTVHWYKCGDKYYHIGLKRSNWDESLRFCAHLFQGTYVANFTSKPEEFAKRCHFSLSEKRQYWIECWYGQPQRDCTQLTKKGQTFKTSHSSCSNLAYPICETSNVPIKTTTSLTTRKTATRKILSDHTTSKPTLAPITSKIATVPTTRKTTSVPLTRKRATKKTTSVLTTRKRATRKSTSVLTTSKPTLASIMSKIKTVPIPRKTKSVYTLSKPILAPTTSKITTVHTSTRKTLIPTTIKPTLAPIVSKIKTVPKPRKLKPVPTTRKPTLAATTSKIKTFSTTGKITSVPSTSKPTLAPTTSKIKTVPTTGKITSVPTTTKTTSVPTTSVSTVVSTTRLPFPILCGLIQGWLNISRHSYCVTTTTYSYSDARKACRSVNGTLADIHSMRRIINPILVGLSLSRRTNLTIWINGTRQGKERLLQIKGQAQFTSDNISSKHQAMCERFTGKQKKSTFSPLSSPTSSILAKTTTSSAIPKLSTSSAMLFTTHNSSLSLSQRGTESTISAMPMSFANASLSKRGSYPTTPVKSVPYTTGGKGGNYWVPIGAYDYYVNYDVNNYTSAEEYCKTVNALLMTFLSPMRYFQILSQLNVSNGAYWIGANNNGFRKLADNCLSYHRRTHTLSISNCTTELFTVCSRYRNNVTEILENVAFMQMLKDMTVDKADTSINKRRLISVNKDHRWSVKAAGSISVLVICLTVMFPLLIDLNKLVVCRKIILCKTRENGKSGE